jgi:hypothetical protein
LGSAYKARFYGDGDAAWVKEVTHPAYAGNRGAMQATSEPLADRWIGLKAVIYNFVENGKTYVRMESYIDDDVTDSNGNLVIGNNWKLASVYEDKGGWSTSNPDFNDTCFPMNKDSMQQYRQRDEILNLPGGTSTQNIAAWRSDSLTWNWKYLVVREIVPQIYPVDSVAPSVAIVQPVDGSVLTGSDGIILVTGTSSDAGSGVKVVEVRLDGGSYIAATPKAAGDWSAWTASPGTLSQGSHRIYAKAIDNAGIQGTTDITVEYRISDLSSRSKLFATVLPYVSLATQSDIYAPHMTATDDSKLHVGLNRGFTDAQLTMVKSLDGIHGVEFFSLAEIRQYAATIKAKGFDYVSYDLEPGATYSPQSEVNDPVGSVRKASEIAHANGLLLEVAPSRAITTEHGEQIAPYVDMYHIQSQALQGQPAQFESYVKSMSAKLKAANPNLKSVTIQFSTNREAASGMTLQETMQHDWNLCSDYVDGVTVWFSNNDASLSILREFIEWFDEGGR